MVNVSEGSDCGERKTHELSVRGGFGRFACTWSWAVFDSLRGKGLNNSLIAFVM